MKQKEPSAPLVKNHYQFHLPISSLGVLLLINIMILQKFQNQWWTFDFLKRHLKTKWTSIKALSDLNMEKDY